MPANWKEQDIRDKQSVRSNQEKEDAVSSWDLPTKKAGALSVDKSPAFCITKTSRSLQDIPVPSRR